MRARHWLSWFGFALFACGGRTLDDGVYGAQGAGNTSCSYQGKTYADGSLLAGACVCFCNRGQVECEAGCTSSSGGASSGGASSGGHGNASSGGTSSGGSSAAGTGGVSSGGSSGVGATGGTPSGGSSGVGGTGGTPSSGGTGGSVACGPPIRATGFQPLIDDMEDGDRYIQPYDGRSGTWFTYNDGTSMYQFPSGSNFTMQSVASDASGGRFVANTSGKGFTTWGAGMGFVLNSGCPYDASIYHGIHFFARAELGGGTTSLYVLLPTGATTPWSNGGTCVQSSPSSCYDDYQTTITLQSDWTEAYVSYAALAQQGWGTPAQFDPRTLMGVNFQTLYGQATAFSFSIDSVSFY